MARTAVRSLPRFRAGRVLLALVFGPGLSAAPLAAQEYTNLQVLPPDISREQLTQVMRGFTSALGLRCSSCHVGEPGAPLDTYDFAADDRPGKLKAREMMKMVRAINGEYLASLPRRREPATDVTCVTCHRGVARPQPIETIVEETMRAEDLGFAIERYRELRARYHGSAAYDFTDGPLVGLARRLADEEPEAARRLLDLNLEFHPESVESLLALGAISERTGDTAAAIGHYRRVTAIDPGNRRAQERLKALGGGA